MAVVWNQTHSISELFLYAFWVPIIILSFAPSSLALVTAPVVIPGALHNSLLLFLNAPVLLQIVPMLIPPQIIQEECAVHFPLGPWLIKPLTLCFLVSIFSYKLLVF